MEGDFQALADGSLIINKKRFKNLKILEMKILNVLCNSIQIEA